MGALRSRTKLSTSLFALADDVRLRILGLLVSGEVSVSDLYSVIGILQPVASKHLGVLRRAGLVSTRRQGLWMYYRLAVPDDPAVAGVLAATVAAVKDLDQSVADRRKLERRTATVVKPQAW